jgi:PAS domain S-box-containing protein
MKKKGANTAEDESAAPASPATVGEPVAPDAALRSRPSAPIANLDLEMRIEVMRQKLEQAEAARARYFDLYDLAPVGYLTLDGQGCAEEANLTAAALLGVSREDLVGKTFAGFIARQDHGAYDDLRARLSKTGMPQTCEVRMLRKGSSEFWVRIECSPLGSSVGDATGSRCVISDISDRRRADINERRLESIFRAAPIGIGLVRRRVIMEVNDTLCRMTGYSRFELIGQNSRMLYPSQEDFEYVGREKYRQIEEEGSGSVETRWRRKSGEILGILLRSTPVDPQDIAAGVTFTALDITERKRAEAGLHRQLRFEQMVAALASRLIGAGANDLDRAVADALRDMGEFFAADRCYVFRFDPDGEHFDVSHEWCREGTTVQMQHLQNVPLRNFPWFREQMETQSYLAIDDVAALPPQAQAEKSEFESQDIVSMLLFPFHKSGRVAYMLGFDCCRNRTRWEEDRIGLVKVVADILGDAFERAVLESDLRTQIAETDQALALVEATFDAVPDIIGVQDEQHRIVRYNKAGYTFLGKTPSEVTGRKCYQLIGRTRPCRPCATALALKTGRPSSMERFVAELNLWMEVRAYPVRGEGGKTTRVVEHLRDITEQKRVEDERRQLERQIHQTQRLESLGVMAGGIAHDFNNILAAILGQAELALDGSATEADVRSSMESVRLAATRAAGLCREMLAYAGRSSFECEPVHFKGLVEEMAELLRSSISKSIDLQLNLADDLPPVEADPSQMRQIVMNLIINASQAMGESEGVITVSTRFRQCGEEDFIAMAPLSNLPAGPYVFLEVADTGQGMDAATRARIFEPFFTTKPTGRGLGLAAVMGIVRSLGGMLKVYSEPGSGSLFRIALPAMKSAGDSVVSPSDGADAADESWRGRGAVLLADDEAALLTLGSLMLRRLGFEVVAAKDGVEAVEALRRRKTDIVLALLDLTMPRMSGMETCVALREISPDLPVVMSSGYSASEVAEKMGDRSVSGIIQKPFTLSQLRECLRTVLDP